MSKSFLKESSSVQQLKVKSKITFNHIIKNDFFENI